MKSYKKAIEIKADLYEMRKKKSDRINEKNTFKKI